MSSEQLISYAIIAIAVIGLLSSALIIISLLRREMRRRKNISTASQIYLQTRDFVAPPGSRIRCVDERSPHFGREGTVTPDGCGDSSELPAPGWYVKLDGQDREDDPVFFRSGIERIDIAPTS